MNVTIKSFGQLAEITGAAELQMQAADLTSLRQALMDRFPELKDRKFALAVNKQLITENTSFKENDVVALLPPFSGG
jgi:molybdopterin synthase sulfur carrier subunit